MNAHKYIHKYIAITLLLGLLLTGGLIPKTAQAGGEVRDEDSPVRLRAIAITGPIGVINSLSPVIVNGRAGYGQQHVWGGDLLHASGKSGVRVSLDSIGQVTLAAHAMARLATGVADEDDKTGSRVLIVSLISGDISVKLNQEAGAFIQACGTSIKASSGASFRIGIRAGEAVIDTEIGEVQAQSQAAKDNLKINFDAGPRMDVVARSTRSIQMQVTDEHDNPVPDIPIILTLSTQSLGGFGPASSLSVTVTTNPQGIASAPFTSGPSPVQGSMTARVPGTNVSKTMEVRVKNKSWLDRKKMMAGAAAVAIIIITDPFGKEPVRAVPPPTVIP